MNSTDRLNAYYLIVELMKASAGGCEVSWGRQWKMRVSAGQCVILVHLTRGYPGPDGRWHRTSRSTQLDIGEGTANLLFMWLNKTVNDLEVVE